MKIIPLAKKIEEKAGFFRMEKGVGVKLAREFEFIQNRVAETLSEYEPTLGGEGIEFVVKDDIPTE